jgi:hypothetical protein
LKKKEITQKTPEPTTQQMKKQAKLPSKLFFAEILIVP